MNACTVSVATTMHRTLPLNVCTTDDMSSNMGGANTTNLINININNAGNITAVAAGENHIIGNTFSRSTEFGSVNMNQTIDTNSSVYGPQGALPINDVPCTLQHCELNTTSIINSSQCNSFRINNSTNDQILKEQPQSSNQSISTVSHCVPTIFGIQHSDRIVSKDPTDFKNNSILPPPLFGEPSTTRETLLVVPSETPKTQSIKRQHRTIPKHVANTETSNTIRHVSDEKPQETTKKASCQCPVQHVPCSYMGSHLNSDSNSIFLSTLSTKLNNIAQKQQPKLKPSNSKTHTSNAELDYNNHSLRRSKPNLLKLEAAHPSLLSSDKKKINIRNDGRQLNSENNKETSRSFTSDVVDDKNSVLHLNNYSQNMDVLSKTVEPNPTLPPKLYKIVNSKSMNRETDSSFYSNSKTHAVTRPCENIQFSILNISKASNQLELRQRSKSIKTLPRTESIHSDVDKVWKSPKVYNQQYVNNTLPKNGKQNRGVSITEVVNKVPSIITLPHPQIQPMSLKRVFEDPSSSKVHVLHEKNQFCQASSFKDGVAIKLLNLAQNSEKQLPVLTTSKNCANPKQHFLPNETSLDDEYLSECENCKTANGSRYYLGDEENEKTMETMTLQRKMPDTEYEEQQSYYRVSSTLPTNTNKKQSNGKSREPWFSTIPASSSSDDDETCE